MGFYEEKTIKKFKGKVTLASMASAGRVDLRSGSNTEGHQVLAKPQNDKS